MKKSEKELRDLETAFTYFKDRAKGKTDHISVHEMSTIVERRLGVSAKDTKSQEQILDLFKTLDEAGYHKLDKISLQAKEFFTPLSEAEMGFKVLDDLPINMPFANTLSLLKNLGKGNLAHAAVDAGAMAGKAATTAIRAKTVVAGAGAGAKAGAVIGGIIGTLGGPVGTAFGAKLGAVIGGFFGGRKTYVIIKKAEDKIIDKIKDEL